jgi:hypothetical protein
MSRVFVFGSNLAGRHGKGAALHAIRHHGAIYGVGEGHMAARGLAGPQSYAIPTKDANLRTLPLDQIRLHVESFLEHARICSGNEFEVTAVGCGLAGYRPEDIAPFFADAPPNCILPDEFKAVLRV